jgi:hypothetical protein
MFSINGLPPMGNVSDGYAINEYALQENDFIIFIKGSDENWGMDAAAYFEAPVISALAGQQFELKLLGYDPMAALWAMPGTPTATLQVSPAVGAEIKQVNPATGSLSSLGVFTDSSGKATLTFNNAGAYHISATGVAYSSSWDDDVTFGVPYCQVVVTEATTASAPLISGAGSVVISSANATLSSDVYEITGYPTPVVSIEASSPKITWNDATSKLDFAALPNGSYSAVITATNTEGTATLTVNISVARLEGAPDAVVDYMVPGSQYTNMASYGLDPYRLLNGTLISIGNFGGYVTVKYNTPIQNDPNNLYGIDFKINGNSNGGQGFSEPGNVWVSQDGETWYLLAGSEYYDDNTIRDYELTYTRNADNTANYFDNKGSQIVRNPATGMYRYPLVANYPLYNWQPGEDNQISFAGPLLTSSAVDPYGSASAAYPDWGYVDVRDGDSSRNPANPYVGPTSNNNGAGSSYDISWAVDAQGNPVYLNEISYIKVSTASHIYAGAIGEKSTEVSRILSVIPGFSAVGVTPAPSGIEVNSENLDLNADKLTYMPAADGSVTITVNSAPGSNVYINNKYGTSRSFATAPTSGMIRVIVQQGNMEPVFYYLYEQIEEPEVELFSLAVNYAAATQGINVYKTAMASESYQSSSATSLLVDVEAGIYWVEGVDANGSMGRVMIEVSGDTSLTLYMRQYLVTNESNSWLLGIDYTFSVVDNKSNAFIPGNRNGNYMRYTVKNGDTAYYEATPIGSKASGYVSYNGSATYTGAGSTSISIPVSCAVSFTVPSEATLFVGTKRAHFVPFIEVTPTSGPVDNADGTKSFNYVLASGLEYNYRVSQPGKVTYTNKFTANASSPVISVAASLLDANGNTPQTLVREASANNGFNVANVYLNINEKGYLTLEQGDEFQIVNIRTWQAVDSVTNNYFVEPDYHYSIVNLEGNPISVDLNGRITALGNGVAIVLVTYDAITWGAGVGSDKFYGAIWPENTGVLLVSVGQQTGGFETGMLVPDWYRAGQRQMGLNLDSEFDVIYYNASEDGAYYNFTPESGSSVSVLRPTVTDTAMTFNGGFTSEGVDENNGEFSIRLIEGRNVVKITNAGRVEYQLITAKKATVTVINNTNPGAAVMPGDNVSVVFDTIYHPANKLAGIYNFTMQMAYALPDGTIVRASAAQYNFASSANAQKLTFTVPANYEGSVFTLSNGRVGSPATGITFGDPIGNHRATTYEVGRTPNFTAIQVFADMAILPNVEIAIGQAGLGPASGDINGDGFVTMDEALMVAQIVVGGGVELTPAQFAAADIDSDGRLTMADVMLIMRKAAGI